eukprot:NODE_10991_length_270_cov_123.420814_g9221_i0.p2 GENE.NODE_10991_length_270_cov_123.420814_g9221_i0~~NODE_10991_length_270_cov_123.420814_g9221_i0.p2  ORF type:complete len:57 (+),score=24.98 NODE_10991_length_270_cov_123.420814_g9221_i0:26-172(+)
MGKQGCVLSTFGARINEVQFDHLFNLFLDFTANCYRCKPRNIHQPFHH